MHSCETNFVALKQVSMIKVVFLTLMRACCDGYVNAQVFFSSIMRKNVIDELLSYNYTVLGPMVRHYALGYGFHTCSCTDNCTDAVDLLLIF